MIARGTAVRVTVEAPGDRLEDGSYQPFNQHAGWLDRAYDGEGPVYLRQSHTSRIVLFPTSRILHVEELPS